MTNSAVQHFENRAADYEAERRRVVPGPGDLHALARAQPDQVSLELGDHRQHVEQQPPHRIGGIVYRTAEAELDVAVGEVLEDRSRVG